MKIPSIRMKRRNSKIAFSMVEMMFSIGIAAPIVAGVSFVLIFAMRAQATYGEQSMIRSTTDAVLQRLAQDIRNTSASTYNSAGWQTPGNPALSGITFVERDDIPTEQIINQDDEMSIRLFDSTNGLQITWEYDRTDNTLERTTLDLRDDAAVEEVTDYAKLSFSDLVFREIKEREFQVTQVIVNDGDMFDDDEYQGQWANIDDRDFVSRPQTTAISIRGRTVSRITRINTLSREVDGNDDGIIMDDTVGARFFNRTDRADNPSFQYIYNFEVAFRNS